MVVCIRVGQVWDTLCAKPERNLKWKGTSSYSKFSRSERISLGKVCAAKVTSVLTSFRYNGEPRRGLWLSRSVLHFCCLIGGGRMCKVFIVVLRVLIICVDCGICLDFLAYFLCLVSITVSNFDIGSQTARPDHACPRFLGGLTFYLPTFISMRFVAVERNILRSPADHDFQAIVEFPFYASSAL